MRNSIGQMFYVCQQINCQKKKHRVGMNRLKEKKYIWNALMIKTIVSKDTHMNNKIVNENKEWFHCAKTDSCYFGR